MAEHGIRDFLRRQAQGGRAPRLAEMSAILPKNSEIEEALAGYQRLFGGATPLRRSRRSAVPRWRRCAT